MKRKVRTHTFNRVRYYIEVDGFVGSCSAPNHVMPEMAFPNKLAYGNSSKARADLLILLHEVRHAQNFDLPENIVERESKELRDLLWRLGYRRVK